MDEKEPKLKDLRKPTHKQKLFIREYLKDLNATQAARRAGYSSNTAQWIGPQLLRKPHVNVRVKKLMERRAEKVEITADYVLGTIKDTVERCRQATPVYDKSGNLVLVMTDDGVMQPVYAFDPKNVLRGCELLGKHLGIMTERVDIFNGGDSNLSHDERAKLARARMIEELEGKAVDNEKDANEGAIGDDKGHDTDAE